VGDSVAVEVRDVKVADMVVVAAGEREGAGSNVGVADASDRVGLDVWGGGGVGLAVLLAIKAWVRVRTGVTS
jgi:hypothetical protein